MFRILTLQTGVDAQLQAIQETNSISGVKPFGADASFNHYILVQFDTKLEGATRYNIYRLNPDTDQEVYDLQNKWDIGSVNYLGQDDNFNRYIVVAYDPPPDAPVDNPPSSGSSDA